MKLSRASGYAVLAVLTIARHQRQDPGGTVQIKEIASENDLPQEYIAKILTTLAKARILNSDRGRDGGFSLRRRASEISVLDIVEAVDGPMEGGELLGRGSGGDASRNVVHGVFNGALHALRRALRDHHIEQMLS